MKDEEILKQRWEEIEVGAGGGDIVTEEHRYFVTYVYKKITRQHIIKVHNEALEKKEETDD